MASDPRSDVDLRRPHGAGPGHESRITELTEANRRLKRKLFDLYTLFEISRNLTGLLETDRLLDHLLLTAIGQMGIGAATVIIDREEEDAELTLWRCKGLVPPKGTRVQIAKSGDLLKRLEAGRMPLDRDQADTLAESDGERRLLGVFEAAMVCPMLV